MPVISRFYGIVIRMYYNEKHGPPFHAEYGEYKALIDIATGEILAGALPRRALRLVLEWAVAHREELDENWRRARDGKAPQKIQPLK